MRKGGNLDVVEVVALGEQVLDVLCAAHQHAIWHRDIKPGKLYLTRSGMLKVLDFGIAHVREGAWDPAGPATRPGAILGTPAFMAPEQARGRWDLVDGQTDLWAVGATMFTLLSGRFVHEPETINEQLALAMMAPARSIASVVSGLPPRLVDLVDRATAYKKADRWPSAEAMREEIGAIGEAIAGGVRRLVVPSFPPPEPDVVPPFEDELSDGPTGETLPVASKGAAATDAVRAPIEQAEERPRRSARSRGLVIASIVLLAALAAAVILRARAGASRTRAALVPEAARAAPPPTEVPRPSPPAAARGEPATGRLRGTGHWQEPTDVVDAQDAGAGGRADSALPAAATADPFDRRR